MKDYIPLPLPFIPGWDVSGVFRSLTLHEQACAVAQRSSRDEISVLEVVGSGVTKFEKGDEVYARPDVTAHGYGAYAEYVVVKETETALKQNRLTMSTPPRFLSGR